MMNLNVKPNYYGLYGQTVTQPGDKQSHTALNHVHSALSSLSGATRFPNQVTTMKHQG